MIGKVILLSVGLMAIVFVLMAIKTLLKKHGSFPNLHIGGNPEMKKRGIHCAKKTNKKKYNDKRNIHDMEKKKGRDQTAPSLFFD